MLGSWPWPREGLFLALASKFFCVLGLGLDPCFFDSTSGRDRVNIVQYLLLYNCLRYSVIRTYRSLLWVVLRRERILQDERNLVNVVFVLVFFLFTHCIYTAALLYVVIIVIIIGTTDARVACSFFFSRPFSDKRVRSFRLLLITRERFGLATLEFLDSCLRLMSCMFVPNFEAIGHVTLVSEPENRSTSLA